jgi:predicted nucleotidyltransferase
MKLEFYPVEKLKKEIIGIVGKWLDLSSYRVFFFGSRVAGKGNERSDIDVGIEGPETVPLRAMAEIEEEIESLPTLYKVEIVDFKSVAPIFKEVALGGAIEPLN